MTPHHSSNAPRRSWLVNSLSVIAACVGMASTCSSLMAQTAAYPTKPIKIIVGSGPGGASDTPARALAQQLETVLKQPVVVENRPGVATILAARAVRTAPPDGYTFFFGNPSIFSKVMMRDGMDAAQELTPVAEVIRGDVFILSSVASGIDSVEKMVAYAKTEPLRCGYVARPTEMTIAMVAAAQPFKFECIPYKSIDQVIQGMMSNEIQVTVSALTPFAGLVSSNKMLLVGVAAKERSSFAPVTRTLGEQGATMAVPFRNGLWGPLGLPDDIAKTILNAVRTAANNPAFKDRIKVLSNEVDVLDAKKQIEELALANAFFSAGAKLTGFVPE
jgi:tripartite-type tricarboxylate transporter receptor subunit TctC